MKALINEWSRYLSKDEVERHMIAFCQASQEDKECMIAETFGIFDIMTKKYYNLIIIEIGG